MSKRTGSVEEKLFPEMKAGGYARWNQFVVFYTRVRFLLTKETRVLDFGAGRGVRSSDSSPAMIAFLDLRSSSNRVLGIDVDQAVHENPSLDEARTFEVGERFPVDDASVDLIVSCSVFEHVADAEFYASEIDRVLTPGGWLCAFTPNKWGYVGIGARLIPNSFHTRLLKFFIPEKEDRDTFPTVYRMNTLSDIRRLFPPKQYQDCSYRFTGPPRYHGNRLWLAKFWMALNWFLPNYFAQSLHIFVQKRSNSRESNRRSLAGRQF